MAGVRFGVSYFGVRDPRHARADLDEIAGSGFTAVTHTFSEHDLRWHEADLAAIVGESRARGLEVSLDPWGVAGLFGGEAYSELALVNLDARQLDAEGHSVPACCPNAPATRELMSRWTERAAALGPDRLFWDEPHFYLGALRDGPSPPCCRCRHCGENWRARHAGEDLPAEGDPRLPGFRSACLAEFLGEAVALGRGMGHTLCLLPRGEFAGAASDDWDTFAAVSGITRLATDPYWMDRAVDRIEFVRRHVRELRAVCERSSAANEVWIQGIRIPAGEERVILDAVEAAVAEGAERICFWSFRGTERMSALACGDPDRAWAAMKQSVRRFA